MVVLITAFCTVLGTSVLSSSGTLSIKSNPLNLCQDRRTRTLLFLQELQNCKSLLNNHQQENVGSLQKKIPHIQGKGEDSWRGEITFRIKPHTWQRCLEGSNKALCALGPRNLTETELNLPLSVYASPGEAQVSTGLLWVQGLWMQQIWDM